jgi:hypothetical protein
MVIATDYRNFVRGTIYMNRKISCPGSVRTKINANTYMSEKRQERHKVCKSSIIANHTYQRTLHLHIKAYHFDKYVHSTARVFKTRVQK